MNITLEAAAQRARILMGFAGVTPKATVTQDIIVIGDGNAAVGIEDDGSGKWYVLELRATKGWFDHATGAGEPPGTDATEIAKDLRLDRALTIAICIAIRGSIESAAANEAEVGHETAYTALLEREAQDEAERAHNRIRRAE